MVFYGMRICRAVMKRFLALLLGVVSVPVLADTVNYIETQVNGENNVAGLSSISDVAVSPDGKFVYTSSYASSAVSVFERDLLTGELTYRSTMTGATAAFSVDVSNDGKSVYAASPTGGKIFAYSRNAETGELTAVSNVGTTNGGTAGFVSVSVSPDSKHVYGVGGSPSGLVVFERDQDTGDLTVLFDYKDSVDGHELGQQYGPTISPIKNIVTSADGQFVYVTSTADNAVTLFSRNATTGELTQVAVYKDGINGVDGLLAASSAKRSPDGKHLYVTGQSENSVAVFSIDGTTGELTYLDKMTNGAGGIEKLAGARSLAVSPDGRYVMVSAITANALTIFSRNASTGLLTLDSVVNNNENGVTGLSGPSGMSTDSLNRHLYVAGQSANSLVVFSLPTPAVSLTTTTATAEVSGSAVTLDNALSIFDSDSTHLISANVSITSGFISTDILAVQTVAGISASYDSAVGVLSLSGNASLADYQAVLRSLSYQAGTDNSLAAGESSLRTIAVSVTDTDNNTSAPAVITVAVEKPDGFTVTFVDWDNEVLSSQLIASGGAATAPTAPDRTGYGFTGWHPAFDNVTADLTVTARYSINTYTVTFDLNGGSRTGGGTLTQTVDYGLAATAPVFTGPAGTTFTGWSTSFDTVTANLTVTAQYSINSYSVTFNLDGGSRTGGGALAQTVNYGEAATAPVLNAPLGKTFSGWSGSFDNVTANLTITAQYAANTFTVTFNLDGGSRHGGGALSQAVSYGGAAAEPVFTPPVGKTFSGWNRSFNNVTSNLTITAQYTLNSHTVTVNVVGDGVVTPDTREVQSGSVATFTLNLMRAGDYVSLGSSCNAALSGSQIVTAAITADCVINVSIHASLEINNDTDKPLVSSEPGRFRVLGGAGEKALTEVLLKRAGKETLLEPAVAESLISAQADGSYLFSSNITGRYTLTFIDAVSNESGQVSFDVLPYVAFASGRQPVQQNVATSLWVWLSDEPIDYPVVVSFVGTGVQASVNRFELKEEDNLRRSFEITAIADVASVSLQQEELANAWIGTPSIHNLTVQQELPSLALKVISEQNGQQSTVVNAMDGKVVLHAMELNERAATYEWSSDGLILTASGANASFDPAVVPAGGYSVIVRAITMDGRTGQYDLMLRVIAGCPLENCENASISGIPAIANPFASQPNRIPVCPHGNDVANRVALCQPIDSEAFYVEVPSQYSLSMGELSGDQSWETGQFGIALNDQTLIDADYKHLGIALDFGVTGLAHVGESVPIAIPLPLGTTIPDSAVWRKYINGQWKNFKIDGGNQIHSAARNSLEQCPGVSSSVWVSGLIAGKDCVRLTIEDGGPNDADGIANSVIHDPGVLAVALPPEVPEPPVTPPVDNNGKKSKGGGTNIVVIVLLGTLYWMRSRKFKPISGGLFRHHSGQ